MYSDSGNAGLVIFPFCYTHYFPSPWIGGCGLCCGDVINMPCVHLSGPQLQAFKCTKQSHGVASPWILVQIALSTCTQARALLNYNMARTGARTGAGPVAMAGWHGREAAAMAGWHGREAAAMARLLEKKITAADAARAESSRG